LSSSTVVPVAIGYTYVNAIPSEYSYSIQSGLLYKHTRIQKCNTYINFTQADGQIKSQS